jgi:hypothetical protein
MSNIKNNVNPKCDKHDDCFALKDGKCLCLNSSDFGEKECPFYKPNSVLSMEYIKAECRFYADTHGTERK